MRMTFVILVTLHGLIHLLGPAKAFGGFTVTQLRQPISAVNGLLWLLAALLLIGSAVCVATGARWWWWLALPGVLLSQVMIVQAWTDARFNTLANVIMVVPVFLLAVDARGGSFRSRFAADRAALLARPRVRNMRIVFQAQMRRSATEAWMHSTAEQYEFFDPPARLFYLNATHLGVPFDVYHRYVDSAATFQVRITSLIPMVDQKGPVMTRSETVTLLNDIVVMAPAAVLDLPFAWETLSAHTVRATLRNAGHTVSAVLTFDAAGDLVGFLSNDRAAVSGNDVRIVPWSTLTQAMPL